MTHSEGISTLFRYFNAYRGYTYQLCNAYVFKWESDFFCLASSGYSYEVEVKVSRSDFLADFDKQPRHRILAWPHDKYVRRARINPVKNFDRLFSLPFEHGLFRDTRTAHRPPCSSISIVDHAQVCPNRFYYATPKDLVNPEEIPDYAGHIILPEDGRRKPVIQKTAPALHRSKKDFTQVLLQKYYWGYLRKLGQTRAGKNFQLPGERKPLRRTK